MMMDIYMWDRFSDIVFRWWTVGRDFIYDMVYAGCMVVVVVQCIVSFCVTLLLAVAPPA